MDTNKYPQNLSRRRLCEGGLHRLRRFRRRVESAPRVTNRSGVTEISASAETDLDVSCPPLFSFSGQVRASLGTRSLSFALSEAANRNLCNLCNPPSQSYGATGSADI